MHPVGFLPPSRSDPPFEVISEPQRQGDDREGRVSEPGARKDRRAGYIQVVGLVNTTVGVDHTATRVFVHAGRAGVVVSVGIWSETGADLDFVRHDGGQAQVWELEVGLELGVGHELGNLLARCDEVVVHLEAHRASLPVALDRSVHSQPVSSPASRAESRNST